MISAMIAKNLDNAYYQLSDKEIEYLENFQHDMAVKQIKSFQHSHRMKKFLMKSKKSLKTVNF